jgi:hypothetical protein
MIDQTSLRNDLEALCQTRFTAPIRIEIEPVPVGKVRIGVLGVEAPWDKYTAGWEAMTDAIDAYVLSRGWHFGRGEWSLSWDGGAIAEWIVSE